MDLAPYASRSVRRRRKTTKSINLYRRKGANFGRKRTYKLEFILGLGVFLITFAVVVYFNRPSTHHTYYGSSTLDTENYEPLGGERFTEYKDGDAPHKISSEMKEGSDAVSRGRKIHVRNAMKHAWSGYSEYAFGRDEVEPLNKVGNDKWKGLGTTLVDSLDTLWIMGMKEEFYEARDWVQDHLTFDVNSEVSVFETTIRSLGGLLSAYDWSGEAVFLEKAEDLGQRLLRSFDNSELSIPYANVNLRSGVVRNGAARCMHMFHHVKHKREKLAERHVGQNKIDNIPELGHRHHHHNDRQRDTSGYQRRVHKKDQDLTSRRKLHESSDRSHDHGRRRHEQDLDYGRHEHHGQNVCAYIAEAGTMQVEFRFLAKATGKAQYKEQVEEAFDKVKVLESMGGLYPTAFGEIDGELSKGMRSDYTFGGTADSFYEYMLKLWLQGNRKEDKYREMYDRSIDAMHTHLLKKGFDDLWVIGILLSEVKYVYHMEHLTCFMGGLLALGAYTDPNGIDSERAQRDLKTARAVTYTCYQMYARTPTGLSPEIVDLTNRFTPTKNAAHYLLRPEAVESFYILHKLTGDPIYREWGWEVFQSIEKYCKTDIAYAAYNDVRKTDIAVEQRNSMESFFLAETLKYLYLLFDSDSDIDILHKHIFNTEAHPLRIFNDD